MANSFIFDFRVRHIETREVRDGNKMLFQGRTNIKNLDGSIEYGDWETNLISENYGDCFDIKPNVFQRLLNAFKG